MKALTISAAGLWFFKPAIFFITNKINLVFKFIHKSNLNWSCLIWSNGNPANIITSNFIGFNK